MIAYAITDPSTFNLNQIDKDLKRFNDQASMVVYRDKKNIDYARDAKIFTMAAKQYSFDKVLLHGDYDLAKRVGADGVHLTSVQSDDIVKAKNLGLFVVISTHTLEDAQKAQRLGADMITYSPIFESPNKGEALGLKALSELVSQVSIPLIALGGILSREQIRMCEVHGASGFASIRYFQ